MQFNNPVVTVGVFDGVHKGHQKILDALKNKASELNGESVVLTLWPHPRMVLSPEKEITLLNTLEERTALLEKNGVDHMVELTFTHDVAQISAEDFVRNILVGRLGMKAWIVGFDNHFGKNRTGNYESTKKLANELGFSIDHPEAYFTGSERISSTNIRVLLEFGEVDKAAELLGYQYSITGKVIEGRKMGRELGFPTANLQPPVLKILPGIGVYAVWVDIGKKRYMGMLNIGFRPTISSQTLFKNIEVHIIDFEDDLYNREITLNFVKKIREERKFASIELLKKQLHKDKKTITNLLIA